MITTLNVQNCLEPASVEVWLFITIAPIASPGKRNSGLFPTIFVIFRCLWAPTRQPCLVGRWTATPALTAALQAALLRGMFPLLLSRLVNSCLFALC